VNVDSVELPHEGKRIARRECSYCRQQKILDLECYSDVPERKPGAPGWENAADSGKTANARSIPTGSLSAAPSSASCSEDLELALRTDNVFVCRRLSRASPKRQSC
jgi:hypothetical protein